MSLTEAEIEAELRSRFQLNPNPFTMFIRIPGKEFTLTVFPPKDFRTSVDQLNKLGKYFLDGYIPKNEVKNNE